MITVFIPQKKGRTKTAIRGFWESPDDGKIYYDYLKLHRGMTCDFEYYKNQYKQETLFYIRDNVGYIYYNKNRIEKLNNRIYTEVKNLKQEIKEAITKYGGATIYKKDNKYFKEIYY